MTGTSTWVGDWVGDRLGMTLLTTASPVGLDLTDLVGLAVRRNPRRAHLLVSLVLGKHVPTDPRIVHGAGLLLGEVVAQVLGARPGATDLRPAGVLLRAALRGGPGTVTAFAEAVRGLGAAGGADDVGDPRTAGGPAPAVVLGYAETATALGQCVAEALGAPGLHSTRRPVAGLAPAGGFEEEHSHATSHLLLPRDPALLRNPVPLVLVDDELSTGRTVMNTIAALQAQTPRERYVIASLVDVRDDEARGELAARALALGVRVDTVALVEGRVVTADDTQARAASLLAAIDERAPATAEASAPPQFGAPAPAVSRITVPWPADLPETARHGTSTDDVRALDRLLPELVEPLLTTVRAAQHIVHRVLVLGTEELMYAPLRLAAGLADALDAGGDGVEVRFSTTTRSPVLVVDEPGYPIRSGVRFPAHDDPADGPGPRFAYNVAGGGFDLVLVVTDAAGDTEDLRAPGGLLSQLDAAEVALITLPTAHAHAHSHEGARA